MTTTDSFKENSISGLLSIFAQLGEKLFYQIQTFYQTKKNIAGAQVDDRWRAREGKLSQAVRLDISLYLSRANEPCIHTAMIRHTTNYAQIIQDYWQRLEPGRPQGEHFCSFLQAKKYHKVDDVLRDAARTPQPPTNQPTGAPNETARPMCQRKHVLGAKMAIFRPNILIILGGSKR